MNYNNQKNILNLSFNTDILITFTLKIVKITLQSCHSFSQNLS